jgi:hypothetical protein
MVDPMPEEFSADPFRWDQKIHVVCTAPARSLPEPLSCVPREVVALSKVSVCGGGYVSADNADCLC